METVCLRCPFHPGDCDYILKEGDAPPCGGFLALSALLRTETVTMDEIRDVLDRVF